MKVFYYLPIAYGLLLPTEFISNVWYPLQDQIIEKLDVYKGDETLDNVDKSTFENWINDQYKFNWKYLLRNVGNSTFCEDSEISPGVIVASPSKIKPNYYYQWTRDSALTIRTLIHYLQDIKDGSINEDFINKEEIQLLVEQYIWNNFNLQRLNTLSGSFQDGGIGEPKYLVNNSAFMENWGRPQNDGPGLRITSIINYMNLDLPSLTNLNKTFVYNEILKPDLVFVANNWSKDSFDLWEEINSLHFFTSIVQLKGLFDGLNFIRDENIEHDEDLINSLTVQYENLKKFVESYYINSKIDYVIESPKVKSRSGLDSAVLLASIHSHDMVAKDIEIPFNIDNNYILNHLMAMINDMKTRYPVNYKSLGIHGIGLGRYPEDIYDGYGTSEGNPWFISTATVSELVFKLIWKLNNDKQDIIITNLNKDFYSKFLNSVELDDYLIIKYKSPIYNSLIENLFKFSDSFLDVVKNHNDVHGGISEQFNKYHGFMQGARDLTWSYSSLLNAFRWRNKVKL
ncbi:putative glucoamylase Glu1p [[Candida] jaroonii]|uniref:Glucoamylase Glu1p n=1 Tax=[Candida] jaroonii TaxID=467808 RepID=A0ACA9Y4V6_9ASCO|nr:putative glucoamylase Glu1p [[Candida] jaroonii]